jgi:hypothetical protein
MRPICPTASALARAYSYDALGSLVAVPVGQVAAGPTAFAIGTEAALLAGAGIIALAVVEMLASPDVRRLEHHPVRPATSPNQPEPVATDSGQL